MLYEKNSLFKCILICLPSEKLTVDAKYLPKNVFDLPLYIAAVSVSSDW